MTGPAVSLPMKSAETGPSIPWSNDEYEMYCPSVDVCAWCGDSECDGIGCIAALDPDDERDHDAIEQLHSEIRRGRLLMQLDRRLALAENRL